MKKLLFAAVALAPLGAGVAANAADMAARPLVPIAYANWTGCHVGGLVGDVLSSSESGYAATAGSTAPGFFVPAGTPITPSFNMNGFLGGFDGGCDYQANSWVFGLEGDWSSMNNDGQAFELTPPRPPGTLWVDSLKERWFATARGRVGYAVDKYLFFVSGGAAWAKLDSAEFLLAPVGPFTTTALQSDRRSGWTAGVGMEYALSYGWSMRTEYLYIQFPSYTTFSNGVFFPTNIMNQSVGRLSNYVWRTGFSYKFGYAPAVAK